MHGGHDLGGMHGLGPINPEPEQEEPVFHSDWERRVFALTIATGMLGQWNIDESRHARERQHPVDYLRHSYYENWLAGIEKLLVEKGLVTETELQQLKAGAEKGSPKDTSEETPRDTSRDTSRDTKNKTSLRVPAPADAIKILHSGGPTLMATDLPACYDIGARVRVKKINNPGHTRAPAYCQGSIGSVVAHHGCHVYPDSNADGTRAGEHLYSVQFDAGSLWGSSQKERHTGEQVIIDLWEPYLEAANS